MGAGEVVRHWLPRFNQCPPVQCRLLARKKRGKKWMSTRDLAFASGLSRGEIGKLQVKTEWNRVPAETMHRFSLACGVNLLSLSDHREFIRRRRQVCYRDLPSAQERLRIKLEDILLRSRNKTSA